MFEPLVVTYRNLSARIVYAPSDKLYHASWSLGGLRGKVASEKLEHLFVLGDVVLFEGLVLTHMPIDDLVYRLGWTALA